MRPRAFLSSPLRATSANSVERHCAIANRLVELALATYAPFVPHWYVDLLDDSDPAQRAMGRACSMAWLAAAQIVLVWKGLGVTEGMQAEIQEALDRGIAVRDVTDWLGVLPVPHEVPANTGRPAGSCWRGCLTLKDCEGSR